MKNQSKGWFAFKGIRSTEMGIELISMPTRGMPAERGKFANVAGRSGHVWVGDGGYDNIDIRVDCYAPKGHTDEIAKWLSGEGDLLFADEPERIYKARVAKGFQRSVPYARLDVQKYAVTFSCLPHKYALVSEYIPTMTAPGLISNPGTLDAYPKIMIEGSGDITLNINGDEFVFEGLTDGIVIDSEMMECLSLDESQLLNSKAQMYEFPVLHPGTNTIAWAGNVTGVTITPRWRYL